MNDGGVRGADHRSIEPFDIQAVRTLFPATDQEVAGGKRLVYLDSAASSLKPRPVVKAVEDYLAHYSANVHRGLHALSERATEAFENAREQVARFLGVDDSSQLIFTRGTTEAINLVAQSWGRTHLKPGDAILVSELEHHSNLVPWQMLAQERGLELRYAELTDDGRLELAAIEAAMTDRVRLIAVTGMSNVIGTSPDLEGIVALAHDRGVRVVVDAAQSLPHHPMNLGELGVDFLAFSGHKMCGPTGIGVLFAKRELLDAMPPVMGGGSMVVRVDRQGAEWNEPPWKFEAGTPPIAEAIGLGAAVEFLGSLDLEGQARHERLLLHRAHEVLGRIEGLTILGPEPEFKGSIVSFVVDGVHPHDVAQLLDRHGVAIRAGHHCAMPLHTRLKISASARASFYLYNTLDEVDRLGEALESIKKLFSRRGHAARPSRTAASHAATEPSNG